MSRTVTSLFESEQHAAAAARRLELAGIPGTDIDIWSTPHNLAPLLEDAGVTRTDAYALVERVVAGGSVIIVSCAAGEVDQVAKILDETGAVEFREPQRSQQSEELGKAASPGRPPDPS